MCRATKHPQSKLLKYLMMYLVARDNLNNWRHLNFGLWHTVTFSGPKSTLLSEPVLNGLVSKWFDWFSPYYHHSLFTHYVLIYKPIINKAIRKSYRKKNKKGVLKIHGVQKEKQIYVFTWTAGPPAHATFLSSIGVFCQQLRIWTYLSWWL